jgi:biopolymer transport protein TolR
MQTDSAGKVAFSPNVTPMIDVMLVLLIVFMVVAPALVNGVVAEPPVAANLREHPEEPSDHTLSIDAAGALYLDKRLVAAPDLKHALAEMYPEGTHDRVLYIRAHKDLAYAAVISAMDAARGSGVAVVGLISERKRP